MIDTPQSLTEKLYQKNLELLYERKRMEQLLYSVSEAVVAVDAEYKITIFNNAAEHITGRIYSDAIGKDVTSILQLVNFDGTPFNLKAAIFNETKTNASGLVINCGEKKFFVNFNSVMVTSETGHRECLITLSDITNEKQLERAKDDFISVASHELRTPMTIIKSYLWMLTAGKAGTLNTKQLEFLYKASNATQRMIDLINDTLNISRVEQGRVEYDIKRIPLVETIKEHTADFLIKFQERKISFAINDEGKEYYVFTDKGKIGEVIINLVGNAIKFTRSGGVTISFKEEDKFVKVLVVDTGAGIDEYDQKNLFHKFGRLDNSYQTVAEAGGTGLGLYIVKLYIEGMGGTVGGRSDGIGKGSTFWFTLPKA